MKKTLIAGTAALALALGLSACAGSYDDSSAGVAPTAQTTNVAGETTTTEPADDVAAQGDATAPATAYPGDDDTPLTGETLEKASAAALKATKGGKVTEAELETDERDHRYEVEVTFSNGEDVTVELDEDFSLVRIDD